jgi:hypothetical protein
MGGDISRIGMLNSRKKDLTENIHPSMDRYNQNGSNPLPLNMPMNTYGQFGQSMPFNTYQLHGANTMYQPQISLPQQPQQPIQQVSYNATQEINLDDILDDLADEPDDLDSKLVKIKTLHTKIIADKKRRRKELEKNMLY